MPISIVIKTILPFGLAFISIMLIIDIQDGSLDVPVFVLHHLNLSLVYFNNLKLVNLVLDLIVIQSWLNCFNFYLFNFTCFWLINPQSTFLLKKWFIHFLTSNKYGHHLNTAVPKLTFLELQLANQKALITIP